MGLEKRCHQFIARFGREVGGRNVEDGLATNHAFLLHAEGGARIGNDDGRCKFGIGIKLQAVLDYMGVFKIFACFAAADDKAAVGDTAMVAAKLLKGDKMHDGGVIPKEIRRTMRIREGDSSQTTLTLFERFVWQYIMLLKE